MPAPELELEPGEEVLATTHVSFRGAAGASTRATFALGSARMRHRVYEDWRYAVELAGFPTAGPEMVLAVTQQRLLVCKTTFWVGRIAQIEGAVPLAQVADIGVVRRGIVVVLTFALTNGQIVEVEAMRGRQLTRFANAARAAIPRR